MSEMYGQSDKALSRAADFVEQARGDVAGKCHVLGGRVQEMMGGWGGQGATAFNTLMTAWQDKQAAILKALDQLSAALVETEKDNLATDEAQFAAHTTLQSRLG